MDGSSKSSTYGPNTIPVTSIPMIRGSFSFWQMAPIASPTIKISDNDANINPPFFFFYRRKKADASCDYMTKRVFILSFQIIVEVISYISAVLVSHGRTSFPLVRILYYHLFLDMLIAILAARILTVSKTANHTVVILPQIPQSALFYFPPETNLCNRFHRKR